MNKRFGGVNTFDDRLNNFILTQRLVKIFQKWTKKSKLQDMTHEQKMVFWSSLG